MRLFHQINEIAEGNEIPSPFIPKKWNIGILPNNGVLISSDDFLLKLDEHNFDDLLELISSKKSGEIRDRRNDLIFVEPADKRSFIITRQGDRKYPSGIVISLAEIKDIISFARREVNLEEGVKRAWRRSGKKIKRGFRVTSGIRRGRVVANIKTAYKPRAKASTRTKLRLAAKKKKVIRVLKGRITKRKPLHKRLVKLNT